MTNKSSFIRLRYVRDVRKYLSQLRIEPSGLEICFTLIDFERQLNETPANAQDIVIEALKVDKKPCVISDFFGF